LSQRPWSVEGVVAGKALDPRLVEALVERLRAGENPLRAAAGVGVSKTYAYGLRDSLGRVFRPESSRYSQRYLDRDERYEIARLREQGLSVREIGRRMQRAASTISRELARNADPRTGRYHPQRADNLAWQRQRRPKTTVWARRPRLREKVQQMLDDRLSPEQVAGRLPVEHPDDPQMRVSHESIYRALYVYPRGELTRVLKARLRTGRTARRPRGRVERRARITDMVSIHDRPEEVADRLIPGHHEGDLIKGSVASNSAIGTIVERHSGYLTLLHLPHGWAAEHVAAAITTQMSSYPSWFAKTLTWDRGVEMARHRQVTAQTGIKVYFADPYSPHQRPSNENTNGLLREYFPKGSDLSVHSAADLQAVQDQLNDRPRKRLGFLTPREVFASLQSSQAGVATTA
jgi:IS30 family transposase